MPHKTNPPSNSGAGRPHTNTTTTGAKQSTTSTKTTQRISRAQLTDILQYTPQIPSICCAAAHPHLRYARETVAGTRADHIVQHRGDLYVCWDWTTNREYHSFSGGEDELAADLAEMSWWLTRPFLDSGEPMILEVNVKKQSPVRRAVSGSAGTTTATTPASELESILRILTSPPYQMTDRGISCLRSLIFTPNRLEVTPVVLELIAQLTHLEKLECFSQCLTLPLPAMPSVYVLKLRNCKALTDVRSLLTLSRLRKLSLCRCSELTSVAALAQLTELTEVRLANCRRLDLKGDYRACTELTSFSMRWCKEVLNVGDLATLPHLRELDCSYCGLRDVEGLVNCGKLRRLSLRGCQTIHQLFAVSDSKTRSAGRKEREAEGLNATSLPSSVGLSEDGAMLSHSASTSHNNNEDSTVSAPLGLPHVNTAPINLHSAVGAPLLWQLEELDAGESSLDSVAGIAQVAPELRHLTVRECKHLHSLSPLGQLPTLTSVDASFSGIDELQGLSDSFSLEYVNLKNCTQLRSVAPLAKVQSLREVDLSVLNRNCIICIDDGAEGAGDEDEVHGAALRRRRSALTVLLHTPTRPAGAEETQIDTAVTQRSAFGMSQHHVPRTEAEALLSQPLSELRVSEAGATTTSLW